MIKQLYLANMATSGEVGGQGNNSTGILNKLDNAGGLWGVVTGAPRAGGSLVKRILVGRRRNTDPKAPDSDLRYSQFISSVDDKTPVYDEHGRLVPPDKREDLNPELNKKMKENVYPAMEKFWTQHIERLSSVVNTYPHLLQDKSSYIYYQFLQARSFCTDAGPTRLGQLNVNKLREYFQTVRGYNETMRYMEEEMTRLEQSNNLIMLMQKQHQPGGFDAVNLGIMTAADRRNFALRIGTGMIPAIEALLVTAYFVRTFGAFVPGMITALPPLIATALGPWAIGAAVAAVPFGLMIRDLDRIAKTHTAPQIMQECNSMWYAITNRPAESAYMLVMYGVDPQEFRFDQSQQKLVINRDLATGGWEQSKNNMLNIKETRRLFYDALGIKNPNMFGVPEEAFFDAQGRYRPDLNLPIRPEGAGMIYQQDIWNRFRDLGGHGTIDANGQHVYLSPTEAIRRFQQARREVIIAGVESQAGALIEADRKKATLSVQNEIIEQRKTSVEAGGTVHKQLADAYDSDIKLYTVLNDGEGGKPGMVAYAQEWKGATGSVEDRLSAIFTLRQEVYTKIATLVTINGPVEDVSVKDIKKAITKLEGKIGNVKSPKKGTLQAEKERLAYLIAQEPKEKPVGKDAKGGDIMASNPELERLQKEDLRVDAEIDAIKAQIKELSDLSYRLANELKKYVPTNEHGKTYAETMRKMKDAYDTLVTAAAQRNTTIGPVLSATDVDSILCRYPHSSFTIGVMDNSLSPPQVVQQTRPGRIDWIMLSLVNESSNPPWAATENGLHEHRMMVVQAIAYARAQESLAKSAHASNPYDAGSGKTVGDFFAERELDGTLNEMLLLASNDAELQAMGTKGGIDMAKGDNTSLRAYARERYDTFAGSVQWIVDEQTKLKDKADKDKQKVTDRLDGEKKRYELVAELITNESGTDQSKKISAQTWMRGLTGNVAVNQLTDRETYATKANNPVEMARYQDYEKRFMAEFKSFPPGMLEFLDVVFRYRSDKDGEEKLKLIYELMVEMDVDGITQKEEPQILLADMIYASHPSIREMILASREEVRTKALFQGTKITESWDQVVLRAFQYRHQGSYGIQPPPPNYYKVSLPSPFSCSELNAIMTSIQHQIIDKAVRTGARVNPQTSYVF